MIDNYNMYAMDIGSKHKGYQYISCHVQARTQHTLVRE